MFALPTDATETTDAAREGAREGTAVGASSVAPMTTGCSGREKTRSDPGGKLDDGEGARAARAAAAVSRAGTASESRTVLSTKASISSVEDCVGKTGAGVDSKGSGEPRRECAVAREPGPED